MSPYPLGRAPRGAWSRWHRVLGLALALSGTAAPGTAAARGRGSWLGIAAKPVSGGAEVTRLLYRGAATRSGVRVGDVVTALDGRPVRDLAKARAYVVGRPLGSAVQLSLRRGHQALTLAVRATRRPKPPGYLRLFLNNAALPDFTLPSLAPTGRVTLSKLRGRVVLVLFWASWCDVCKTALPRLERLQRRYGTRRLVVVAVSRDRTLGPLQEVTRRLGLQVTVAHDPANAVGTVNRVKVIPSLLFLDRFGVVRSYVQGAGYTDAQLGRVARRLLGQRRPRPSRARIPAEAWL